MQSCAPTLCKPVSDPSAYCALVADACEFNRGLSRDRASRLPFLDLATQITQKPAPWLYRKSSERSRDPLEIGTHVVVRYVRQRWSLNQLSPAKRRKLAADRLWYNLQTGLGVLGVPAELFPIVTKRAFAIANLPIPASLASQLEASGISRTTIVTTSGCSSVNRRSVVVADSSTEQALRKFGSSGRDDCVPDEFSEEPDHTVKPSVTDASNKIARIDEGLLSFDSSVQKRITNDDRVFTNLKTDDDASMNTTKSANLTECNQLKTYELDEDSEGPDDAQADGVGEDEDDDFEDDCLEDDDVEWVQPRGRRAYASFEGTQRPLSSRRQLRRTGHVRKGSGYSPSGTRLSERRLIRGRQFSSGSQDQFRGHPRPSESAESSTIGSVGHRRSGRIQSASKAKPSPASSLRLSKEKDTLGEEHWIPYSEPGFQLNSSLFPAVDRTYADAGSLCDVEELAPGEAYSNETSMSTTIKGLVALHDSPKSTTIHAPLAPESTSNSLRNHGSLSFSSTTNMGRIFSDASSPTQPSALSTFSQSSASRTTIAQLLTANSATVPSSNTLNPPSTTASTSSGTSFDYATPLIMQSDRAYSSTSDAIECTPLVSSKVPVPQSTRPSTAYRELCDSPNVITSRNQDYSNNVRYSSNRANTPLGANIEPFATPQSATTTVTFFVCEVCSSRYRSTAGLRYHYHSQHSGYTPKNPISASASRLVVPIGEERGIGGGLRGGRPRRHKVSAVDGRSGRSSRGLEYDTSKTPACLTSSDTPIGSNIPNSTATAVNSTSKYGDTSRGQQPSSADASSGSFSSGYSMNSHTITSTRPSIRAPISDFYASTGSHEMKPQDCAGMYAHPNHSANVEGTSMNSTSRVEGIVELQRIAMVQRAPPSSDDVSGPIGFSRHSSISASSHTQQFNWSSQEAYHIQRQQGIYHPYHLTPSQRRFERQRCSDRVASSVHPSHVPSCIYCLGDERMNPRIGRPEGLLRCSRCATWAHFTCLHLPAHVIDNAMRYPWQCIECKTCWLCGSPEQENRLIFCSDCDRVFHVDCLPVPISRLPPPSSHWSCDICLHDLYAMSDGPSTGISSLRDKAGGEGNMPSQDSAFYSTAP